MIEKITFAFFGTDEFAVTVLEELKKAGLIPSLIVTAPDRPAGRGMKLTPSPVKIWGGSMGIEILQPEKLNGGTRLKLQTTKWDVFVVASYGKIIPQEILGIPKYGVLNVHPSLLPLYRGPSPIQSQILDGAPEVGVTIMLVDEKMDHGSILVQRELGFKIYNLGFKKVRDNLATLGGKLIAEIIPRWIAGDITPQEQEHSKATYTKKVTKEDGLINLNDDPKLNYQKFLAYTPWPGVYFFKDKKRIKITDAALENDEFKINRVIPEGKKEVSYEAFLQSSNA